MKDRALLGDEAVALGAMHAGISAANGYPGTPSTEIMEFLQAEGAPNARWNSNEKTALEEALGTSFCGKRALVTMKHIGLNVAADPFINGALLDIKGGVVLAVADDPGMHSSQNEQDSRYFADFAMVPCLEPTNQQEAYEMTRRAFDLSEELSLPVVLRLVTRLSHSRATIVPTAPREQNPLSKALNRKGWTLIPAWARLRYGELIGKQEKLALLSETSPYNPVRVGRPGRGLGIITTGLARNYFAENAAELTGPWTHLHIGQSPWPVNKIRDLMESSKKILVLEEGMPLVERNLRGIGQNSSFIAGKLDGTVPRQGELNPDSIRAALGLKPLQTLAFDPGPLPPRPPQLCRGCPHEDSFKFIKETVAELKDSVVTADIGCYALGVLPPLEVPETVVCMGGAITLAKGAATAGHPNVIAVIGDSTFYHSGLTGLVDCVANQSPVTIIIMDNATVAMTGGQQTIQQPARLPEVIEGLGVKKDHIHVVDAIKKAHNGNVAILKKELAYNGPSVIITVRECLESIRKRRSRPGEGRK